MNNIYIEKTPETCEECSCCYYDDYAECYKCPLLLDNEINIYDKDSDCPLKPLTDRLAEERKKVIERIRESTEIFTEPQECDICKGVNLDKYVLTEEKLNKILDQIERGEL